MKKFFFALWFITIFLLLVYSFTQVDLNLTLSRVPLVNNTVKTFQAIGYFQRPLSTAFYLTILTALSGLYFVFLRLSSQGRITRREFWVLLIITATVLLFSYPAFSYDIYNYMFDAKTIVLYHKNPWQFRPLDFTEDRWLTFMRWTHRPSIYPPGWVFLSLPFYFLGFNIFLLILLNFKLLMALGFLGSVWLLEKLLSSTSSVILGSPKGDARIKNGFWTSQNDESYVITALVFYAFNPLMLIENLVSSHNDIVMIFFILLSFWLAKKRNKLLAVIFCLLSVLIKYVTGVLVPLVLFYSWLKKRSSDLVIYRYSLILVLAGFLFLITRIEIQPWYLVWLLPFVVLSGWKFLWPVAIGFSLGLLLRYAPFLYQGDWGGKVPVWEFWLTLTPLLVSLVVSLVLRKKSIV